MSDFTMPSLGADMERATLVEWRVAPGAHVRKGDIMAVVETHKGAIEIESFEDGLVRELVVPVGTEAAVGAVLARLDGAPATPAAAPAERARISPATRKRAVELGVDLAKLADHGPDSAITLADVERAASPQAPARRQAFDPAEMRRAIATAMSRSKREIPHYYLSTEIDCARALSWLDGYNATRPPAERILPAAVLLKAVALALAETPQLNGFWEKDQFGAGAGVHIGWAIALKGGGLIAPALHAADRAPLPELMRRLADLIARARQGGLRGSELSDPTITVSSLGDRGADALQPVIYPPQVAILGFGRIAARPFVVEGAVVARPTVIASLAADHRASDGHLGGQFLAALDRRLQQPEAL